VSTIVISAQTILNPDRLEALRQAMSIREMLDKVIFKNHNMSYVKEKLEYFPTLEEYDSDGLRLKVWVEYKCKGTHMLLKRLHRRGIHAWILD